MTLRVRIAVVVGLAVAGAAAVMAGSAYVGARSTLLNDLDRTLRDRAAEVRLVPLFDVFEGRRFVVPEPGPGSARSLVQLADPLGRTRVAQGQTTGLPVTEAVREVARGEREQDRATVVAGGQRLRMLTIPIGTDLALQVALPMRSVTEPLRRLAVFLFGAAVLAIAGAAAIGTMVARAIVRPVGELTEATERIARTRNLRERIAVLSSDEIGRLADSFNMMLAALDESTSAQRQLVADASHELRTPIASLRTNIEVLARGLKQAPEPALRIVEDLVAQSASLSRLVADLLDLSREADPESSFEEVPFDELTDVCIQTARSAFPGTRFEASLDPVTVRANPVRLERAVTNLLENAAKWSPPEEPVEIGLRADGTLTVRDHGPGVAREHRERIFERFWRAPDARGAAGSGLGLAIVRRIARDHAGTVHVEEAPGGGAAFVLWVPPSEP